MVYKPRLRRLKVVETKGGDLEVHVNASIRDQFIRNAADAGYDNPMEHVLNKAIIPALDAVEVKVRLGVLWNVMRAMKDAEQSIQELGLELVGRAVAA